MLHASSEIHDQDAQPSCQNRPQQRKKKHIPAHPHAQRRNGQPSARRKRGVPPRIRMPRVQRDQKNQKISTGSCLTTSHFSQLLCRASANRRSEHKKCHMVQIHLQAPKPKCIAPAGLLRANLKQHGPLFCSIRVFHASPIPFLLSRTRPPIHQYWRPAPKKITVSLCMFEP